MTTNPFTFRNITEALPVLCRHVLEGDEVGSRNGRVKELSPVQITLTHPWEREVLAADRHASLAAQIAETMWVLAGRDDVEWLSHYLPRAKDFSDDGTTWRGAYGPRIRRWKGHPHMGQPVDQLRNVIDILREDPSSRRAVINLFDPAQDFQDSKDIPCNNWLHFLSRGGKLNLHVAIRSNDLMWGWSGINAFEWSVLQEIVASCLGIQVGTLTFSISSLHLYEQHWAKAEKIAQGENDYWGTPMHLRRAGLGMPIDIEDWDGHISEFFKVEQLIRVGADNADRCIRAIGHPSIRAVLRVIQFYWQGRDAIGDSLVGTALGRATDASPNHGRWLEPKPVHPVNTPFIEKAIATHIEKHAAYGDSWKKRGEAISIQANIARKVDRLGGGDTSDETQADTALDLLVYLAKYTIWIQEKEQAFSETMLPSDGTEHPNAMLRHWDRAWQKDFTGDKAVSIFEGNIKSNFEALLKYPTDSWAQKRSIVRDMAQDAYALAKHWDDQISDDYPGAHHE